ncbi:MAG: hypothetical protein RIS80_964, partial [Actinomycetota bacterium]
MGLAMANRLLDQGFPVDFWNRSPREVETLIERGARQVSLEDALQNPFAISMLSNDSAALQVFSESVLASARPGLIHLNMSTLSLDATEELAARHSRQNLGYVASPVLGRPIAITNGKLLIVAAGESKLIEAAEVVFERVSAQHWNLGADHKRAILV